MVLEQAMISSTSPDKILFIAGIGFSSKASATDIVQAVQRAMHDHNLDPSQLHHLACLDTKRQSKPLETAARDLGLSLIFVDHPAATLAGGRGSTHSQLSIDATDLPSASEAAALAAAGATSTLLAARSCHGPVTCALAFNTLIHPSNQADQPATRQNGIQNEN